MILNFMIKKMKEFMKEEIIKILKFIYIVNNVILDTLKYILLILDCIFIF